MSFEYNQLYYDPSKIYNTNYEKQIPVYKNVRINPRGSVYITNELFCYFVMFFFFCNFGISNIPSFLYLSIKK